MSKFYLKHWRPFILLCIDMKIALYSITDRAKEEFEHTKGVTRILKSKDKQHYGQKKRKWKVHNGKIEILRCMSRYKADIYVYVVSFISSSMG